MKEQNEKQAIEEMAQVMCDDCAASNPPCEHKMCDAVLQQAKALYNAGCRQQSVVIDEFAKRLKEKMDDLSRMEYNDEPYFLVSKEFIDKIAEEMKDGAE